MKNSTIQILISLVSFFSGHQELVGQIFIQAVPAFQNQRKEIIQKLNLCEHDFHSPNLRLNHNSFPDNSLYSRSGIKQRLDSVVFFSWDFSNKIWIPGRNDLFIYNSDEKIISDFQYRWDNTGKQWNPVNLDEFTYDANGDEAVRFKYIWDQSINTWGDKSQRLVFIYDQGNLLFTIYYKLEVATALWIKTARTEYKYNSGNKLISIIYTDWDETKAQYIYSTKEESDYDVNNNLLKTISYDWIDSLSEWHSNYKSEYINDINGRITIRTRYNWSNKTKDWLLSAKDEYIYYTNSSNWDEIDYYYWDEFDGIWKNSGKDELIHDSYGNLLETKVYYWESGKNQFELLWDFGNKLDYNTSLASLITLIPDFTHKLIESSFYGYINNQLTYKDSTQYYYSDQVVSDVSIQNNMDLNIYPNPSSDYLICEMNGFFGKANFEMIDLFGRQVLSKTISIHNRISIQDLTNGIYSYRLQYGGKMYSGKIIVEH